MKKLYGIMGFAGFVIMLGAAGGAERVSFSETLSVMVFGLILFGSSFLLVKSHNMRMRRRRQLIIKANSIKKEAGLQYIPQKRLANAGITAIVTGKINSPELC